MLVDQVDDSALLACVIKEIAEAIAGEIKFQNAREMFGFHVEIELLAQFRLVEKAEKLLAYVSVVCLRRCHVQSR